MQGTWRGESGANAVEFALVLPVLIMLLFGVMWGAALLNTQQTATQAAREGARYGAILPLSEFGAISPPPASDWYDAVTERSKGVLASDMPLATTSAPTVCVRFYDEDNDSDLHVDGDPDDCPGPSDANSTKGGRVEVTIRQPARLEFGMGSVESIIVTGSAVARYEPSMEEDE